MASFDVQSLFTNIPIEETIQIILDQLFDTADATVLHLNKGEFKTLLELAVKDSHFIFDGRIYKQIDGVAMGSPLGPVFANIFLAHHESVWLQNCPAAFKPALYKRYVDDTFLLFEKPAAVQEFLNYMNDQHPNMRFTAELEEQRSLPFLGIKVFRTESAFDTSIYRKPTDTGLYTNFDSFSPNNYKIGLVKILLHRAYSLCSTYASFHTELLQIKSILQGNGYCLKLIDTTISKFLNKIYSEQPSTTATSQTVQNSQQASITLTLPFIGHHSSILRRSIRRLMGKSFPTVKFRIAFNTLERIGTRFQVKDRLPKSLASNVVYHFTCGGCNATYVGQTTRHFAVRCADHLGVSARTGGRIHPTTPSQVHQHLTSSGHACNNSNFKIIDSAIYSSQLKIKEALHILFQRPTLNLQTDTESLVLLR